MNIAIPPGPPDSTETGHEDIFEALIEEAKQRARRRRRRVTYGVIASAVVVAAVAASATFIWSDTLHGERSGLGITGGATANGENPDQLVASMYEWSGVGGSNLWLYVYADGRLISTSHGVWREQRLTPEGVELVRADIISSGLFDPDEPPPGSQPNLDSQVQVRSGERLVYVARTPDRDWTADYERVTQRLRTLQSWLPASAWAEYEPTFHLPARYAICIGKPSIPLLPAAAAALLNTAPALTDFAPEIDPATYERTVGGQGGCFDLTREQAQTLATSLNETIPPGSPHIPHSVDADNTLLIMPILPHGVAECACYG